MTEPPAREADPVGLVFGGMAFGVVLGVGLQGLVTFAVDALKATGPIGARPSLTAPHALVLLLGTPAAHAVEPVVFVLMAIIIIRQWLLLKKLNKSSI